ncbi:MAG: hypothetical protein KIS92_23325 [Planctomycetota bacterium]|nr:hypothetical protein [Planctomycetota bacterium]
MNPYPTDREWSDPWTEGRRENEAEKAATFDGEPPPGFHTRRDCAVMGAGLAGLTLLAGFTAAEIFTSSSHGASHYAFSPRFLHSALWVALPPLAVLGAAIGRRTYTVARVPTGPSGLMEPLVERWYLWLLAFCLLNWFVVVLYFQFRRRYLILSGRAAPGWGMPCLHLLFFALLYWASTPHGNKPFAYVFTGVLALLFCESVLVTVVARWRNERRLLPPPSHNFQFSLGSLMACVFALGAYGAGVAQILRSGVW